MKHPFPCLWCGELVLPEDLRHTLLPDYHYACALRVTLGSIGHLQGTCSCYVPDGDGDPPELTRRQAARLVADHVRQQQTPTPGKN